MIPNEVKIGGMVYKVLEKERLISDHGLYGQVTYQNNRISIDGSMDEKRKESVFVHEVFHAVMFESGYEEHDEEMVRRISNVLYQVFKDNPNLLENKT